METGALIGIWALIGVIALLILVFTIYTLVRQAKRKNWVWFVVTMISIFLGISLFVIIAYWASRPFVRGG